MTGLGLTLAALLSTVALSSAMAAGPTTTATDGDADFAADLYRRVAAGGSGNVFLSPFSVRAAMAMAAAGAGGRTAEQLSHGLHLSGGVPAVSDDGLGVANAVWMQRGLPLRAAFTDKLRADFGSAVERADFAADPEAARAKVNAWVLDRTRQKIADLLPPRSVTSRTRLVLANAVYFKADWSTPFEAGSTRPAPFHLDAKTDVDVPMMRRHRSSLAVVQTDDVAVVELPYKGDVAMLVVVPKAVDGLAAVERKLTGDQLRAWVAALAPEQATVSLPKFTATAAVDLAQTLGQMGMADAFDPDRADFSAMVDDRERLSIGGVFHKAYVAVDEQGTEAAAATGITMRMTAMLAGKTVDVVADRPFLYLIRDRRSGAVLFAGRCADPR